jgi:hypothetical protein
MAGANTVCVAYYVSSTTIRIATNHVRGGLGRRPFAL